MCKIEVVKRWIYIPVTHTNYAPWRIVFQNSKIKGSLPWLQLRCGAFQIDPIESFGVVQVDLHEIFPVRPLFSWFPCPRLTAPVVGSTFERNIVQGRVRLHSNIQDPAKNKDKYSLWTRFSDNISNSRIKPAVLDF